MWSDGRFEITVLQVYNRIYWSPLVVRLTCKEIWFGGCPWESGETSLDVVVFVLVAAPGRKPFGTVPEIVLAAICTYEIIDAVAGRRDIGGVRVHLAVLE